jgi:hypothetical protein
MVRVWSGLPGETRLTAEFPLESVSAMAVPDDGQAVLAATTQDERGALVWLAASERRMLAFGTFSALAFRRGSRDAAAADSVSNEVILFRNVAGEASPSLLAGASEGVAQPIGVAFSADGRKVLLAGREPESLLAIDIDTGFKQLTPLGCRPDGLFPLGGNAVFRLTASAKSPVCIYDGDAPEPVISQIPAGVEQ